ncbi:MAG: hypothetical protein FWG87_14200 [Defluviitaleaceae bacterium]|nr:hypothetical protein [Defluviitaleaceae bacterium]
MGIKHGFSRVMRILSDLSDFRGAYNERIRVNLRKSVKSAFNRILKPNL